MSETKQVNLEDLYDVEIHDGQELAEDDYDELLCNCQGILSELTGRKLPKRLLNDIHLVLERLNDALGWHRIH
jgi:hypothetical protein